MGSSECPFCNVPETEIVVCNAHCFARWDRYPVSQGHLLVMPFRHYPDYFDATPAEVGALWTLVHEVKTILTEKYQPDGFNVGVNIGTPAGQSVPHVHVHVIPRYQGDTADPFGGIRAVVRGKGCD